MYESRVIRTAIVSAIVAAPILTLSISYADETCTPRWDDPIGLPGAFNPPIPLYEQVIHKVAVAADLDGDGDALYVAGKFTHLGGVEVNGIAKWNPQTQTFSPLGQGLVPIPSGDTHGVRSIVSFDDGSGTALYVGGGFNVPGVPEARNIARWDGKEWSAVGQQEVDYVGALIVFDDGTGPALYSCGWFAPNSGSQVAKWNPESQQWIPLGGFFSVGMFHALTVFDDGNGPALYAGGSFLLYHETILHDSEFRGLVKWNHESQEWAALNAGLVGIVNALIVHDDGSGEAIYAGGYLHFARNSWDDVVDIHSLARWNGSQWSNVGTGFSGAHIQALAEVEVGSDKSLYAGGHILAIGGVPARGLARWDGSEWEGLFLNSPGYVSSLATFDNNGAHEPRLYAGGDFTKVEGVPAFNLAGFTCGLPCVESQTECVNTGRDPGCVSIGCARQIAEIDPTCCLEDWHQGCADLAALLCATYQHDDGENDALFLHNDTPQAIYLNEFETRKGAEVIDEVEIDFWTGYIEGAVIIPALSEVPMTLHIWRDTVGNGDPSDALLLASQEVSQGSWSPEPVVVSIDPVYVGPAGSRFFIGVELEAVHDAILPFFLDVSEPTGQSWFLSASDDLDPADIAATATSTDQLDVNSDFAWNGNFPIRANGFAFTPAPGDLDYDGSVNVSDLLLLLQAWGPCTMPTYCPADLTGDGSVSVPDLLMLLAQWG